MKILYNNDKGYILCMEFDKLYEFEQIIKKTNNIRDLLQIAVSYYVYFDLKKHNDSSLIEDKNIRKIFELIISEEIYKDEIENIRTIDNFELKKYLDVILHCKKNLNCDYCLSSSNPMVHNINSYIPIIKKGEGVYDGHVSLKKVTEDTKIDDILKLFLFKRGNLSHKMEQEVYLVKIHQSLIEFENSYEIFFAIEDNCNQINHHNSFIVVSLIDNVRRFYDLLCDENINCRKPMNLVKNFFAYGMVGNMDLNSTNILIKDSNDCEKFYIVDPTLFFAYKNVELIEVDLSLKAVSLFSNFIQNFTFNDKKNIREKIIDLFVKYFLIFEELLNEVNPLNKEHEIFISRMQEKLNRIIDQNIVNKFLIKMADGEIWQELVDIRSNINYEKLDNIKNLLENNKVESFVIEECNVSIPTAEYHEIITRNIRDFDLMMEKYV